MNLCRTKTDRIARTSLFLGIFALIFFLPLDHFTTLPLENHAQRSTLNAQRFWQNFFSEALDNSGLEVRDSRNRVIKSAQACWMLKELFVSTVFKLLVEEDLPLVSSIRKILEEFAAPLKERFRRAGRWLLEKFEWAMILNFKRFLEFITGYLVGVTWCLLLTAFFSLTADRFLFTERLPQNLPLRC